MNKIYSSLGIALAATLSLTGCTKQLESPAAGGVPFEVSTLISKTANDGMGTKWTAGDAINLFHAETGTAAYVSDREFTVDADLAGKFSGTLASELTAPAYDWYAIYPYSASNATPEAVSVTVGGASQSQSGNNSKAHLSGAACPLWGVAGNVAASASPAFSMKQLSSVICVEVSNASGAELTVGSVAFTSTEDITGTYSIDFTGAAPVYAAVSASPTAALTVSGGEAIADGASANFYLAIKPHTAASGSTLKLAVNGTERSISLSKDAIFKAGAIKTLKFKMGPTTTPAAPVFTSIAPTDTNYDKIYIGRELTVSGENMATVEKFVIASEDGSESVEAALSGTPDDASAKFVMPSVSGTAKKTMKLAAVWGGGNKADFGTIEVYPFMYTKGLRIGVGSNSNSTYTDYARENAFLVFDRGEVISAQSWKETPIDKFALASSNSMIASASANKLADDAKSVDYYSVMPYTFLTASSTDKLAFQNPSNSPNQLKCHRYPDGTSVSTTFGTPNVFFKVITDNVDFKAAVAAGAVEDIASYSKNAGASAPACAATEASNAFAKGSVLCVQYATYEHAHVTGDKITARAQVRKIGYIYIRDITCADDKGAALADRTGYIEFDLYWSNVLN